MAQWCMTPGVSAQCGSCRHDERNPGTPAPHSNDTLFRPRVANNGACWDWDATERHKLEDLP